MKNVPINPSINHTDFFQFNQLNNLIKQNEKNNQSFEQKIYFPMLEPPHNSHTKQFILTEMTIPHNNNNKLENQIKNDYNLNNNILKNDEKSEIISNFPSIYRDDYYPGSILVNPFIYGFLPPERAENRDMTISEIIQKHFQVRSTKKIRFEHKLWNALCITKKHPNLFSVFGIIWISNTILKVHRTIFANLLGITRPTAALFNIQGSFPSHGFIEIEPSKLKDLNINEIDGVHIRLLTHSSGLFTADSGIDTLVNCRWKMNFA